ncbi:hypothetical protein [Xenorhabdus taiwanensis]|uniref:Uncharacterized protein n=1 Tax=Xenorhabdus taiwanensis TaxID=3085177 RepID=A0ABM8JS70_9GAMM|nr:hypothetical protein TCT1_04390 [Xenorhabdus sp. TCT-1]
MLIYFNITSLKEIIFGVNASENTISNVTQALKKFGFEGKVYTAGKVNGNFSIKHHEYYVFDNVDISIKSS